MRTIEQLRKLIRNFGLIVGGLDWLASQPVGLPTCLYLGLASIPFDIQSKSAQL